MEEKLMKGKTCQSCVSN